MYTHELFPSDGTMNGSRQRSKSRHALQNWQITYKTLITLKICTYLN